MNYKQYYLLSFLKQNSPTTSSQLLHIFQGKRTPSMFYLAERNKWHHAFAQFKKIDLQNLEKQLAQFEKNGFIFKKDQSYYLTNKGHESYTKFIEDHYYPQVSSFSNGPIKIPFWDRYQLFVQIFSEMSYQNKHYTPIIKNPSHQENVRQLFYQFKDQTDLLLENWIEEQSFLLDQIEEQRVGVLMDQLTGNDKIGETKKQLQEQLEMEELEYFFYHLDTMEELLIIIQTYPKKLPILHAIVNQLQLESNYGLSMSTSETYHLLTQGNSISEISTIRHLKENTIREHILELAFILNDFPFEFFVPENLYNELHKAFETKEDYSFKQALADIPELEFMYYRLVELERMRKNGATTI